MKGLSLQALVTVAAVAFVLVIAAALVWKYRPQPTPEGVAANYGTVEGTVTWKYEDIASNYQCVSTYPCAGCTVRFYKDNTLVKEVTTAGASIGKTLGCPQYTPGSGRFSADLLAGDYRIHVPSPEANVGEGSASVTVRKNETASVEINLNWTGPQ